MSELIIDETNFEEYFFDARKHGPKADHVLVCYDAIADLIDGPLKRDILNLILFNDSAHKSAPQIMQKLGFASYKDSIRVTKDMVDDLLDGLTVNEVLEKPYEYHLQAFYYTKEEYIPSDPHWSKIKLLNTLDINSESELEERIQND